MVCPPHLSGASSGRWDPLPAVGGRPSLPQPSKGLPSNCSQPGKPDPASPARTRAAVGSVPLCQLCLTFRQWHLESSSGCAALPHGPRGPARRHGRLSSEGKNSIFLLHPLIPLSALELFLEPKGRKGCSLALLPPLCACSFVPLFPAAANVNARTYLSLCRFILRCLNTEARRRW